MFLNLNPDFLTQGTYNPDDLRLLDPNDLQFIRSKPFGPQQTPARSVIAGPGTTEATAAGIEALKRAGSFGTDVFLGKSADAGNPFARSGIDVASAIGEETEKLQEGILQGKPISAISGFVASPFEKPVDKISKSIASVSPQPVKDLAKGAKETFKGTIELGKDLLAKRDNLGDSDYVKYYKEELRRFNEGLPLQSFNFKPPTDKPKPKKDNPFKQQKDLVDNAAKLNLELENKPILSPKEQKVEAKELRESLVDQFKGDNIRSN
jgi:hypothetical protein